jgi:hypothetical protein
MNQERIINLVQMDLATDQMKLEGELERIINSDIDINKKLANIKKILAELVTIEASIIKFTNLASSTNNNEK